MKEDLQTYACNAPSHKNYNLIPGLYLRTFTSVVQTHQYRPAFTFRNHVSKLDPRSGTEMLDALALGG